MPKRPFCRHRRVLLTSGNRMQAIRWLLCGYQSRILSVASRKSACRQPSKLTLERYIFDSVKRSSFV